jgi:putative ABC transport system permease protein
MSRNKRDQELKEELEAHLRLAAQDRVERGESPAEAQAHARREFGNIGLIQEITREVWGWSGLYRFMQDVRYGGRVLRRNPVFAIVSIFTLALGIGASTAIFSVVYGVLLRPLPYEKPDQIVRLWGVDGKGNRLSFSDANFRDLHEQSQSLQAAAEINYGIEAVSGGTEPQRVPVGYVSHDFFRVFGVYPVLGRNFTAAEETPNGPAATIVGYSFWRNYLGGRTDLGALNLVVENHAVTVVGVMPPGFDYPADTQLWLSSDNFSKPTSRSAGGWQVVGRVRDGISLSQAKAELSGVAQDIYRRFSQDNYMTDVVTVPLRSALTANARPALLILLGVSGLLLLVACANVMNLLLAQAAARESELAVRSALGASRLRLVRQFLAESLLLGFAGAIAGIGLAYAGVRALLHLAPQNLPRLNEVTINLPILLFALGTSLVVAVGLGTFTAVRASRAEIQQAIAQGHNGRSLGGSQRSQRAGYSIIAGQVAVTLVLLVGAGLLARSFLRVLSVNPGFRIEQVVTLDLAFPFGEDGDRRAAMLNQLFDQLRSLPGVVEVGGTSDLPLYTGNASDGTFVLMNPQQLSPRVQEIIHRFTGVKGKFTPGDYKVLEDFFTPLFADKAHTGNANYVVASAGYFPALGIPLKQGRFFNANDTMDAPHAALISESLARQVWPGRSPLGETIEFGNMDGDLRLLTIVGVVGDVRDSSLEAPATPAVYVNYVQRTNRSGPFIVALRTAGDPGSTMSAARQIISRLDPNVPVKTNTFARIFVASLETRRFNLGLVGIFAGSALLLAVAGIYGILGYSVTRRTRELGVRMALGATSSNVLKLVLRQAVLTALVGVLIGAGMAFALTRLMQSMLFGISPGDPLTFVAVALLLIVVAVLAAYFPARRATRIDPMIALRSE